ncbi:MAG TPA: dihydropteroate synthase [Candidatus Rothia avicola]|uniref:Dihydropteroate synthase n=1 Tax=Candidatus Rothia avicola TaxID=2840478 RepID=A0A9D1ZTU3_9MICC|nr:dihydropteroate synthase [Candidatus Rothia avicola]
MTLPHAHGSYENLPTDRTLIMGILNVTPDSFFDGGLHADAATAVAHAKTLVAQGADIIDVGGESTRPGATRVPLAEEQRRVLPVIEALAAENIVMSVDTLNPETARAAVAAGAHIINDVAGMSLREDMIETVAELGVPYILMHSRGTSLTMDSQAVYTDVAAEVFNELFTLRERLITGGVAPGQIILDPGPGFAKHGQQNWQILAGLQALAAEGHRVLVAGSRKRFIARLLQEQDAAASGLPAEQVAERAATERDVASAALSVMAAEAGAWAVRVHNVQATADALAVREAWRQASAR